MASISAQSMMSSMPIRPTGRYQLMRCGEWWNSAGVKITYIWKRMPNSPQPTTIRKKVGAHSYELPGRERPMNTKNHKPANPIPEKYFRPFVLPSPRLRAEDVLELLLAKTSGGSLDAKAALLTLANAFRSNLE